MGTGIDHYQEKAKGRHGSNLSVLEGLTRKEGGDLISIVPEGRARTSGWKFYRRRSKFKLR